MSVLIKGMEMPTNDDMNPTAVLVYPNGYVIVFKDNGKMKQYTEAVPVPDHGRPIDADELEYEEAYLNGHYELGDVEIVTREDIESAPTIIPADHIGDANEMVEDKEGEG